MNKTKISWVINPDGTIGYTMNPIKGWCQHECLYCYSNGMWHRFHSKDGITDKSFAYHPEVFDGIAKLKKHSTILVGSAHDIYGDHIDKDTFHNMMMKLWRVSRNMLSEPNQHTFLLLTKNPERYDREFPQLGLQSNIWTGISITNLVNNDINNHNLTIFTYKGLLQKFISFEPLLGDVAEDLSYSFYYPLHNESFKWFIIGCLNKNGRPVPADKGGTKLEWVLNLLEIANTCKIPVFIKPELYVLFPKQLPIRRDLPYLERK